VTDRAIFNRKYTSYTADSTEVFLANGAGASTSSAPTTRDFTAGEDLIQGAAVYVSGVFVFNASAASGVAPFENNAIGITSEAASGLSQVNVVLDGIATTSNANLVADNDLIPGEYYYLSNSPGQITRFSTASGLVVAGSGYGALLNLGSAVSTTELSLEIQPLVDLYGFGGTGPIPRPNFQNFLAGQDLIQGETVFVSGLYVVPASAASGNPLENYSPVGLTETSALQNTLVPVIFDDVVAIGAPNITAESVLVPGQYYYLSKFDGQITRLETASGIVSGSGGYEALVNMGLAFGTNSLHVQIQPPLGVYS
jgi:hypothetical protein